MRCHIITGTSQGLGNSLAKECLEEGDHVYGLSRRNEIEHEAFQFVELDLSREKSVAELSKVFREISEKGFHEVSLVLNAAMLGPLGLLQEQEFQEVHDSFHVNLLANVRLCQVFLSEFAKSSCQKKIIALSSGAAVNPIPRDLSYNVAKAGLEMMVRSLAVEVDEKTQVIAVRPGIINTNMQVALRGQDAENFPVADQFKEYHAGGHLKEADDVAKRFVARFLNQPIESGQIYSHQDF